MKKRRYAGHQSGSMSKRRGSKKARELEMASVNNKKITSWAFPRMTEDNEKIRSPLAVQGMLSIKWDVNRLGILDIEWNVEDNVDASGDAKLIIEVQCIKKGKAKRVDTKKKTWTKQSNGLFGWRLSKVPRRSTKNKSIHT